MESPGWTPSLQLPVLTACLPPFADAQVHSSDGTSLSRESCAREVPPLRLGLSGELPCTLRLSLISLQRLHQKASQKGKL